MTDLPPPYPSANDADPGEQPPPVLTPDLVAQGNAWLEQVTLTPKRISGAPTGGPKGAPKGGPKGGPPVANTQPARVMAKRVVRPPRVEYATLAEERDALNAALQGEGLQYRVANDNDLREAKKTAGIGNTTSPAADFDAFTRRLFAALRLGALGGADGDQGEQQEYANAFKAAVIREVPERATRLQGATMTFADCMNFCGALTEENISGLTPAALARKVRDNIGHGKLGGLFPGEAKEAMSAEGGQARLDKMNELGRHIVERLREAGDVSPELTGSIVLSGGGYTGVPEDLDVNVTTKGSAKERKEQWDYVLEIMNNFDGMTVAIPGGTLRIFPLTAGKVQGENAAIWERRFGYVMKVKGQADSKVMPLEVEVKDVGGAVWKEHLLPGAEARTTDEEGVSKPKWLMLDTMTRILGHHKNMKESVEAPNDDMLVGVAAEQKAARWLEMVQQEGLDKSVEKRLWEKLNVSMTMARADKTERTPLEGWLRKTVTDTAGYLKLLELASDEKAYEQWLKDIG